MSNLRDLIRLEIERGNLSEPFKVKELRALIERNQGLLGGERAPKDINSYLANHSTGPGSRIGESVRRGQQKLFVKHDQPGTYSIDYSTYELESDSEPSDGDQAETAASSRGKLATVPNSKSTKKTTASGGKSGSPPTHVTAKTQIAEDFVKYLKEKPYRQLVTKGTTFKWGPGPITGWNNRLNHYEWNKALWRTTEPKLAGFTKDLRHLETRWLSGGKVNRPAQVIYNRIKTWGNPRGSKYTGSQIISFLAPLWSGLSVTRVDSTLTKLYALARPDEYAMYDSRVAAAIMTIAEDIYRQKTKGKKIVNTVVPRFRNHFPSLGLYNGTGGTRQRGYRSGSLWPNAYRSVPAQLEANELCVLIRDRLNQNKEDKRSNWTLREVEAVLFMEGY